MRVKKRSGKRDFKYKRERDNAFLRGRDAGIVRYSMAGYGITISCNSSKLRELFSIENFQVQKNSGKVTLIIIYIALAITITIIQVRFYPNDTNRDT